MVLLSTACPTSLASEPNIRGGRSGVQTAPACGAAFGGIDNDQPEIKARQRHRARLDPKPRYPSKDFHHKEIAKKLRDGFRGLREKRKELNHNFKGNTEGNSYVSRRPLLQAQRTRCAQFFLTNRSMPPKGTKRARAGRLAAVTTRSASARRSGCFPFRVPRFSPVAGSLQEGFLLIA